MRYFIKGNDSEIKEVDEKSFVIHEWARLLISGKISESDIPCEYLESVLEIVSKLP